MKRTPMKRKPAKKKRGPTPMKAADAAFALYIRSRGMCEIEGCSKVETLQCAHGFSRRYRSVRVDPRNAFCLCAAHHWYYTNNPLEWDDWLRAKWGEGLYVEIRRKAQSVSKVDWPAELARFRALNEAAA